MQSSQAQSIDHKDIIENQSLVLRQQKKRIIELITTLDALTKTNNQIESTVSNILEKHAGSDKLKRKEQGWKILNYTRQLEEQHSLTLLKLNRNQQSNKFKEQTEENIEIDDLYIGINEDQDLKLRNRNCSMSRSQISTDNDEMTSSYCSIKEISKQINPMSYSGLIMRKPKIGKYKIAQTFEQIRSESIQIDFISEQDQQFSTIINNVLARCKTIQQLKNDLISEEIRLPHSSRKKIWPSLIGRKFQIPTSYYEHLKQKVQSIDPLSKKLIASDITRTFPQLHFFNQSQSKLEDLKMVLQMFDVHSSNIGYVQGMAHLASVLLLVFDSNKVFEAFNNLIMGWPFIKNLYSFNQKDYQIKLNTLSIVVNQFIPKLNRKISSCQLQLMMIQWFFSIFSRNFNINVSLKLWDTILIHGQYMFYLISLSILKIVTPIILSVNQDQIYLTVKMETPKLSFLDIQKSLKTISFTQKDYQKATKRVQKQYQLSTPTK